MTKVPSTLMVAATMGALVAVTSLSVFDISKRDAADSLNHVARQLSSAMADAAAHGLEKDVFSEAADISASFKRGVELGLISMTGVQPDVIHAAVGYLNHAHSDGIYLAGTDGSGLAVRVLEDACYFVDVSNATGRVYSVNATDETLHFIAEGPLDLRDYPFIPPPQADSQAPVWVGPWVAQLGSGGPLAAHMALSVPVFAGGAAAAAARRLGVVSAVFLADFGLDRYLVDAEAELLLVREGGSIAAWSRSLPAYTAETPPSPEPTLAPLPGRVLETGASGNHTFLTLENSGQPLHRAIFAALTPAVFAALAAPGAVHRADVDPGEKTWLEIRPIEPRGLRLFLVSAVPARVFFAEIDRRHQQTVLVVIALVVGAVVFATGLALLFISPLKQLAGAFDAVAMMELASTEVTAIPHTSTIREYHSLYKGFWRAVRTIQQLQAFLPPALQLSACDIEDVHNLAFDEELFSDRGDGGGGTADVQSQAGLETRSFATGLSHDNPHPDEENDDDYGMRPATPSMSMRLPGMTDGGGRRGGRVGALYPPLPALPSKGQRAGREGGAGVDTNANGSGNVLSGPQAAGLGTPRSSYSGGGGGAEGNPNNPADDNAAGSEALDAPEGPGSAGDTAGSDGDNASSSGGSSSSRGSGGGCAGRGSPAGTGSGDEAFELELRHDGHDADKPGPGTPRSGSPGGGEPSPPSTSSSHLRPPLPPRRGQAGVKTSSTLSYVSDPREPVDGRRNSPVGYKKELLCSLRRARHSACLVGNITNFSRACKISVATAVADHERVFLNVAERVRSCSGVLSHLLANRITVLWNTMKAAAEGKKLAHKLAQSLLDVKVPNSFGKLHLGIHSSPTVYGILGGRMQKFSVVGSELVDITTALAHHNSACGTVVLASVQACEKVPHLVHHKIDDISVPGSRSKLAVHLPSGFESDGDADPNSDLSWIYSHLPPGSPGAPKGDFLDSFFAAKANNDFAMASLFLTHFSQVHGHKYAKLVTRLQTDLSFEQFLSVQNGIPLVTSIDG
ncbi:hypothetical protein DIPPA_23804 [Diplonema papillatum]|nr:hypothetical protein DIPPA_23804 [Diplonema papillatum]